MKRKPPFILLLTFLLSVKIGLFAEEDKYVKLANKVSISSENDSWIRVSIPFNILNHPGLEQFRTRRPSTVEELFNPEYIDDLKVKIFLCFTNEFKKKTLRSSQFPDSIFINTIVQNLPVKRLSSIEIQNMQTLCFQQQ